MATPAVGDTINIDAHPAGNSRLPCPLHSLECSQPGTLSVTDTAVER